MKLDVKPCLLIAFRNDVDKCCDFFLRRVVIWPSEKSTPPMGKIFSLVSSPVARTSNCSPNFPRVGREGLVKPLQKNRWLDWRIFFPSCCVVVWELFEPVSHCLIKLRLFFIYLGIVGLGILYFLSKISTKSNLFEVFSITHSLNWKNAVTALRQCSVDGGPLTPGWTSRWSRWRGWSTPQRGSGAMAAWNCSSSTGPQSTRGWARQLEK